MSTRIAVAFVEAALIVVGLGGCRTEGYGPRGAYPWWGYYDRDPMERFHRPPVIRAPDLRPKAGTAFTQGDEVGIPAKVKNEGDFRSGPFDVVAVVTVPGKPPETFTMRYFELDPGEEFVPIIGSVSIAGITRPVDITVVVTADPPTPTLPLGEVIEFDEANNTRPFTYQIN